MLCDLTSNAISCHSLRSRLSTSSWKTACTCTAPAPQCVQARRHHLLRVQLTRVTTPCQMPQRPVVDPLDTEDSAFTAEDDDDDASDDAPQTRFPELHAAIEAAIVRLGGAVFPKLNWSAPKVSAMVCAAQTCGRSGMTHACPGCGVGHLWWEPEVHQCG